MIHGTGREYLSSWKRGIYSGYYDDVIEGVGIIVNLFYNDPESNWGEVFEALHDEIDSLTKRMIGYNEKEYLKSFLKCAIEVMEGKTTVKEFKKKAKETCQLLASPYCC